MALRSEGLVWVKGRPEVFGGFYGELTAPGFGCHVVVIGEPGFWYRYIARPG